MEIYTNLYLSTYTVTTNTHYNILPHDIISLCPCLVLSCGQGHGGSQEYWRRCRNEPWIDLQFDPSASFLEGGRKPEKPEEISLTCRTLFTLFTLYTSKIVNKNPSGYNAVISHNETLVNWGYLFLLIQDLLTSFHVSCYLDYILIRF